MPVKKEIIVIGDAEMGGGTLTDDFISDKALSEFILKLSNQEHAVDLILNGDTFDFLKCPYIENNISTYPRHVTSEISLAKLRLIYNAHEKVFAALKIFAAKKQNRLFFIVGNHDPDLVHKEVQVGLRSILRSEHNIFFPFYYRNHGVYAEHGHQYDFLNKVNLKYLFLNYKGKPILNIPWVSFGIISKFLPLKEKFPFSERVVPRPALFSHNKSIIKALNIRGVEYLLKSFIYYPIRYFYDPTYTLPRQLLKEFYRRFKAADWDVDEIVGNFKKKRKKFLSRNKVYVFGHIHKKHIEEKSNSVIIHSDTWRDEYFLDTKTRRLLPKSKKYVQVLVLDDNSIKWDLVEYPVQRKTLHFDDIVRDEKLHLQLVAAEEGFNFKI